MCVIVPCRAQFSAKLFVRVSYEDTPPEVRSRPRLCFCRCLFEFSGPQKLPCSLL